jgi:pimeloyl-ACP methyl ester carboxylesterase
VTDGRHRRLPPAAWYPAGDGVATSRIVRLGSGLRVRVVEAGPPEGAPVVLLHGWACSAYSFRHQLPALAAAGYRAAAIDLKGHGLSDKPTAAGEYAPDAMARFALNAIDALGLDRVALVGHSLGGGIATQVALTEPARVERLAVISAVGFGRIPFLPVVRQLPSLLVERPIQHLTPRWLWHLVLHGVTGRLRPYTPRDIDEYWAATQFPEFPIVLWRLVQQYGWTPLPREARTRMRLPMLVVYGSRDRVVLRADAGPMAAAEAAAEVAGPAEVRIVAGAGHAAQEEAPGDINRLLLRFLEPWRTAWRRRELGLLAFVPPTTAHDRHHP